MTDRRSGKTLSRTPTSATYDVNKFASPLQFPGAGERRDEHAVRAAALRAAEDTRTLRRLSEQGIDARQARGSTITAVDLATHGVIVGDTVPEVRRIPVFHVINRREQREAERDLRDYLDSMSAVERGARRIVHVRLRPRRIEDSMVPVERLRDAHRRSTGLLARRLDYARRISGGLVEALAAGVHHRPTCWPGDLIDLHFHVALDVIQGGDLDRVLGYLVRHYDVWEGDPRPPEDAAEGGEESIAGYLRDSGARHVAMLGDEQLATYAAQVSGLHRYRTLDPLRRHVGERRTEQTAVAYRPRRLNVMPGTIPSGPTVLRTTTAWIGQERRPALLVRGWNGNWTELAARYDLDLAVAAARHALDPAPYPFTADIPESSLPPLRPPPDPGPLAGSEVVHDYEEWSDATDCPF